MKKLIIFFTGLFLFLFLSILNSSCRHEEKTIINVYSEEEIQKMVEKIAKKYEKASKIYKIEINNLENIKDYDIIITNEENKIKNLNMNVRAKNFTEENLLIIGRKKMNDLSELEDFSLAIPEADTNIGKIILENINNLKDKDKILENISYKDGVISSLQSVDLYEVDFAFITSSIHHMAKNSELCYILPNEENYKILYKFYLVSRKNKDVRRFYQFIDDEMKSKIKNSTKNNIYN